MLSSKRLQTILATRCCWKRSISISMICRSTRTRCSMESCGIPRQPKPILVRARRWHTVRHSERRSIREHQRFGHRTGEQVTGSTILRLYVALVYLRGDWVRQGISHTLWTRHLHCFAVPIVNEVIRHLRNSLAHGHITPTCAGLHIKDRDFEAVLTPSMLNKICTWIFLLHYSIFMVYARREGIMPQGWGLIASEPIRSFWLSSPTANIRRSATGRFGASVRPQFPSAEAGRGRRWRVHGPRLPGSGPRLSSAWTHPREPQVSMSNGRR